MLHVGQPLVLGPPLPAHLHKSAKGPVSYTHLDVYKRQITQLADSIGVQTIFMSKDRLDNIPEDDFIDISAGLNKFHKKS